MEELSWRGGPFPNCSDPEMHLKSLTVKGFKSFAEPVTLRFEPGITVVVGPNGSGKSNVVDALSWALGTQSARTLRSERMDDVIFAGSPGRSPLGRAEVAITIEDGEGRLPGGVSEVTVTRTLFRSGDSEYAIDRQPCRLLDVQELLSDTGIGRQLHMVISQGHLEQVLNSRPEERRFLIEEAASILKHRRRKERAERRLAAADEALERLGSMMRELRRQMRPLERQAAAAEEHVALRSELRTLKAWILGRELTRMEEAEAQAAGAERDVDVRLAELDRTVAELDGRIQAAATQVGAVPQEWVFRATALVQRLQERAGGLSALADQLQRSLVAQLAVPGDGGLKSLDAERAGVEGDLALLDEEEVALAPRYKALVQEDADVERLDAAWRAAVGRLDSLNGAARELSALGGRRDVLSAAMNRDLIEMEQEEVSSAGYARELSEAESEAARLAAELSAAQDGEAALAIAYKVANDAALQASELLSLREKELVRLERENAAAESRLEALERSSEVASAAGERDRLEELASWQGRFFELLDIEPGYERAVEAALFMASAAEVVGEIPDLLSLVAGTCSADATPPLIPVVAAGRLAGGGRVPGLPGDLPPVLPAGCTGLRDRVQPSDLEGRGGVDLLLDWHLANAVVAGTRDEAARAAAANPDLVVVTVQGDRFAPDGWRLVPEGDVASPSGAVSMAGIVLFRRECSDAADRANVAQVATATALANLTKANAAAESARLELVGVQARRTELEREVSRLEVVLSGHRRAREEALSRKEARAGHRETVAAELTSVAGRIAELSGIEAEQAEAASTADSAYAELEEGRNRANAFRRDLEIDAAGINERRTLLSERLSGIEARLAELAKAREVAAQERDHLEMKRAGSVALKRVVAGYAALLSVVGERMERLSTEIERRSHASRSHLDRLVLERQEREQIVNELKDTSAALRADMAERRARLEGLREAIVRDAQCTPDEARNAECPDLEEGVPAESRAAALESRLASLGPINELAVEELAEVRERKNALEEQIADVRDARSGIRGAIDELDALIAGRFTESLTAVNEHFQEFVSLLFPGAAGRVMLTDPDDVLKTGVDIEVRLAGKAVRRLSLFSGGERSLISIAFLFAVFRSDPSPFYVMDEVEAALDDVNLRRFLDLAETFRGDAQLVIVSHQKKTMERADCLYGVTMSPNGTSKIVSKRIEEIDAEEGKDRPPGSSGERAVPASAGSAVVEGGR